MTDEPPAGDHARRARPSQRLRKTMLDPAPTPQPEVEREAEPAGVAGAPRLSLAEALAGIPDLDHEPATAAWPGVEPIPADHQGWAGNGHTPAGTGTAAATAPVLTPERPGSDDRESDRAVREPAEDGGPSVEVDDGHDGDGGRRGRRRRPAEHRPVPWYRRAGFVVLVVVLVGAIPVLGWAGVKLIRESKGGTYHATSTNPAEPGYEALVEPTPTAVVVQRNTDGTPNGLTFIGLGNTKGGGSVMFIPLDTKVLQPLGPITTLRAAYRPPEQPANALRALSNYTALTLGVGFSDTISIDDAGWEELLAKLAPIEIQNPDALMVGSIAMPVGPVQLQANQVGPYLAASVPGESDLNRLNRHEIVWRAIVAKLAASADSNVLPGEANTGLGRYLHDLSKGTTSYETLPVTQDGDAPTFTIRPDEMKAAVLQAVPYPQAPSDGSRPSVRVLDGVQANPRGTGLTQPLVKAGATIAVVGNGPKFGQETTVWTYGQPEDKKWVVYLRTVLGGKGKIVYDPAVADVADVTLVVGKDLRDDLVTQSAAAVTTTTTTATSVPAGGSPSSAPGDGTVGG